MSRVFKPGEGERLQLGAPFFARVVVQSAAPSSGLLVLSRGGTWPAARFEADCFLFIHKGQGRVTVDGRATTVVPGISVAVPTGRAIELRNTGTGELHVVWTCASAALADWFRQRTTEPATAPAAVAPPASPGVQRSARQAPPTGRQPAGQAAVLAGSPLRRRRRRGGRGRRRAQQLPPATASASPPAAPAPVASSTPRSATGGASPVHRQATGGASHTHRPRTGGAVSRSNPRPGGPRRGGRYQKAKEVFMGGRWVRVTGEGPMIAPGE